MNPDLPALEVLGVRVARLTVEEALTEVDRLHAGPTPAFVAFVNAHTLNLAYEQPLFRDALGRAGLVLNDGSGLAFAARWNGSDFPENLNGTDVTPKLLALAGNRGWPVFFLGGRPGVAQAAAAAMTAHIPRLKIVGVRDGYFSPEDEPELIATVRRSGADLLVVALGNPRQELWLNDHLGETGCRVGIGVGAFFDFVAGRVPRAPLWMRRAGIEWVYRLGHEPGRLWRRYVLGNPRFIARVVIERARGRL